HISLALTSILFPFTTLFRSQLIVNGKTFPQDLKHALPTLQNRLNTVGYEQLIEEVAYTWFNRIIAIRYMEVNNYLPDQVNVLSRDRKSTRLNSSHVSISYAV